MEEYNIIKKKYNDKLLFKLCQIAYALSCDVLFTLRIPELHKDVNIVKNLNNGDKVFISYSETNIDLNQLVHILTSKNIKVYFYLSGEPIVPAKIISVLLPCAMGFFLQNNIYDSPFIHSMPIGIRDCETVFPRHKGFNHSYLFNEKLINRQKEFLCLLCFSYTHSDRTTCYNALSNKPFIKNLNSDYEKNKSSLFGKTPININYEYTHKSYYTLSPRGTGEDCHRFYEAIYLNSIPIVKKTNTPFDKLFNIFPCLIVNKWEDITYDLLIKNLDACSQNLKKFNERHPDAFTDVSSMHELLLQT